MRWAGVNAAPFRVLEEKTSHPNQPFPKGKGSPHPRRPRAKRGVQAEGGPQDQCTGHGLEALERSQQATTFGGAGDGQQRRVVEDAQWRTRQVRAGRPAEALMTVSAGAPPSAPTCS